MSKTTPSIPPDVLTGLRAVRATAQGTMHNIAGVQRVAHDLDAHALVRWIADLPRAPRVRVAQYRVALHALDAAAAPA